VSGHSTPASPAKKAPRQPRSFLRFSLKTLMLVVTLCCLGTWGKLQYDWYCKLSLAAKWVEPLVKQPEGGLPPVPKGIRSQEELEYLEFAITRLPQPKQRIAGIKILVETRKEQARRLLGSLLVKSRHPDTRAMLIRLIGLAREEAWIPKLMPYLDDQEAQIRAAAAEAIGFIRKPSYDVPIGNSAWGGQSTWCNSDPRIEISSLRGFPTTPQNFPATSKIEVPPGLREKLEAMMLTGASSDERTAAARALLEWPPEKYSLRLAEWGVWIEDGGELKLVQSVLDEIPPFVHQTGNTADSFADRVQQMMIITKPIVHLTADKPLVVDLEIVIKQGRPWYAYPKPDDFVLEADTQYMRFRTIPGEDDDRQIVREVAEPRLTPPPANLHLQPLTPLSEGYPWLLPNHRTVGSMSGGMGSGRNIITSMGLRWQSIIVSPEQQPWMQLPDVGIGARYAWWKSLRDVPSSWVTSNGETERFLYYDGPTRLHAPTTTRFDGQQLTIVAKSFRDSDSDHAPSTRRTGHFICVKGKEVAAKTFSISGLPEEPTVVDVSALEYHSREEAVSQFLELLFSAGLTKPEAAGLVASWRPQFFETPGTRLLTILSPEDYREICPLSIRPWPTETVRIGIVLTELKDQQEK
jgi:hypothetical protein